MSGQGERRSIGRDKLIEVLEDKYREFGWDVEGAPPLRSAPGEIIAREIDQLADAILDAIWPRVKA